jgi:hypothetical protein
MDGIWDHPYVIDSGNRDRYPLVRPWPFVPISLDIGSHTLNLKSKGQWITAYVQLPPQYNASEIEAAAISLNGTLMPELDLKYGFVANASEYLVDHNGDGVLERMLKFERAAVESWIYGTMGISYGKVSLTLTGKLFDGTPFEGTCSIFVNFGGDVNNDGVINVLDAATVSAHWYPGPPKGPLGYDVSVDLNKDGRIDVLDSASVSVNWGMSLP